MKIILKVIALIALLIVESLQQQFEASVECKPDTNPFGGMFFPNTYNRLARLKCTFTNINNQDQIQGALNRKLIDSKSVISVAFNESNLSSFPDRAFSTYANLRSIDGSSLRLTDISSSVFSGLKSLDSLVLSFNNLTALASKVFANMKMKSLDLSYNLISSIHETTFMGSEIERIDLSFNKIKSTKFINGFKYFNYMQMASNEIENFEKIENNNAVWEMTAPLFVVPQNPTISLQNNKMSKFECSSTMPMSLIDLSNNRELSDIKLNDCEIERLDVSECSKLERIKVTANLEGFTAKNVKFEQIEFGEKNSLNSLILVNNSLNSDVISSISKLENLTYLELNYNHIGPLNISTFAKLKKLQTLKLKATNISNINFGTFSHQNNVRELDISDNNLGSFDMHMIYTMNGLISFDLSGNNLMELENLDTAHLTFSVLEKIDLTNNKWSCVYLMRLIKIMKTYRVVLAHSSIEEHQSNINGIYCVHVEGEDSVIVAPLTPDDSNFTQFREKLNEVIGNLAKYSDKVAVLERRVDSQTSRLQPPPSSSSLSSSEKVINGEFQVKNSALLEFVLIIVCTCFSIYIVLQIFVVVKRNSPFSRSRPTRGISEHTLSMNVDDY